MKSNNFSLDVASLRSILLMGCTSLAALCLGCEKSDGDHQKAGGGEDAGASDKGMAVDPNIAKAVAAASASMSEKPRASSGDENSPPPRGIFEPGQADKQIRIGETPNVTLGSTGLAPRVFLSKSHFLPNKQASGSVQVMVQGNPRQRGLPIDFQLMMTAKPQPGSDPGAGTKTLVTALVSNAKAAGSGTIPPDLAGKVQSLKGSKVEFEVHQNGAASNFRHQLSPTASVDLEEHLRALSDVLATITLPYPEQPVGSGAYWMATSRDGVMGLDLVSYRLVKVERVENNTATLNLSTKRYATGEEFKLAGLKGDFSLAEFTSTAEGKLEVSPASPVPRAGNIELLLAAQLTPKDKPGERGALTVQARARLNFDVSAGAQQQPPQNP